MKEESVIFKKTVSAEARNGYFKQSGIRISDYDYQDNLIICGLTSRGQGVVGHIKLPKENVQDLINALEKMK